MPPSPSSPSPLKRVSKLTITFLVDNHIEWMTKLPAGFTHEILQHVPHSRVDPETGVPVLDFDNFCCGAHGFAALLETEVEVAAGLQSDTQTTTLNTQTKQPTQPTHTQTHKLLFDTGPDSLSLTRNLRALQIPITHITRVVASHWHSDHTGGLLSFLALRRQCVRDGVAVPPPNVSMSNVSGVSALESASAFPATPAPAPAAASASASAPTEPEPEVQPCIVDVHPSRPHLRGIAPRPSPSSSSLSSPINPTTLSHTTTTPTPTLSPTTNKILCALPPDPTFAQIAIAGGVVETHKEGHAVAGGTVWVSGEVPRVTEFEGGLLTGVRWVWEGEGVEGKGVEVKQEKEEGGAKEEGARRGKWVPEPHLMDERYAAVDVKGKGLVLFSSCSHAGIVNVVKDAVATFHRPVYMIIGGLHLASSDLYDRIVPTVAFLAQALRPDAPSLDLSSESDPDKPAPSKDSNELLRPGPQAPTGYVLPMHCTGWRAKVALERALGEGVVVPAGVGHRVEVFGSVEEEGA